jgi:bifunctional non-homologous end joining protein LigD
LIVFDLDPGDGIEWRFVTETALALRDVLQLHELESWPKTSGGKGLNLMVPLQQPTSHDDARKASELIADAFAARDERYIVSSSPAKSKHHFRDYLRNGSGTTAVGAYSPRARPGFPVSKPVSWDDVEVGVEADAFTMEELLSSRSAAKG